MTTPRKPSDMSRAESPTVDEELMDVIGLMLGMTILNIAAVNAGAERRIRSFLEEALEQDFARDHLLAARSINAALDREAITMLADLMDVGEIDHPTDLVAGSRAVN